MLSTVCYDENENFTEVFIEEVATEPTETSCNSSSRSNSSSVASNPVLKLYKRRWLILISYCLLTISAGTSWLCFPAVSNILQKYYEIGVLSVNLLSIIFGVAIVIFSFPFAIFVDKFGLGNTLKVAALMNLIGASIRYFGSNVRYGYWLLLFGNLFTAISVAGFLFLPGKIALTWFGVNEIGKATSFCIASDALGTGLGFLHATYMIKNYDDPAMVKDGIQIFLLSQLIPAIIVFLFVMICVKRQPELPPNMIEYQCLQQTEQHKQLIKAKKEAKYKKTESCIIPDNYQRYNLKQSITKLMKNYHFHLIVHMQGITASIEGIFEIMLNEMLIEIYPGRELSIGIVGFVAVLLGFATNIFAGAITDHTGSFKRISIIIFLLTTLLCITWSILLEYVQSFFAKAIVYCLLMSICTSYYSIAFAHSAQIAVLISPSAIGVLLVLTSQIYDTVTSFIATEILSVYGTFGVNITSVVISLFATVLAVFVSDGYKQEHL